MTPEIKMFVEVTYFHNSAKTAFGGKRNAY